MNRTEALLFAADLLRKSGEANTSDAALLLEQMADDRPISKVTDDDIRVFRDEARATGDRGRALAASAALGLPVGDGALDLLDCAAYRERVEALILRERTPGTTAARSPDEPCTSQYPWPRR